MVQAAAFSLPYQILPLTIGRSSFIMSVTSWSDRTAAPSQPINSALFNVGADIMVNASAKAVFEVISSFSKYSEWNSGTPTLKFAKGDGEVVVGDRGCLLSLMNEQKITYELPVEVSTFIFAPLRKNKAG